MSIKLTAYLTVKSLRFTMKTMLKILLPLLRKINVYQSIGNFKNNFKFTVLKNTFINF